MSKKICVYAICKNELKFVEQWLENMSEADYIVVLDTGSTDGTYEKLQQDSRVTRVEQEIIIPWRFDVARNRSMELIPDDADILVCTDFDELFEPGWTSILKERWIIGYHNVCHYTYAWSHGDVGEPQFELTYNKIHTKDFYWRFPVHEVITPKERVLETVLKVGDDIYLHHWQDKDKPRGQYLELLKLAVEENPESSHVHLLYAREHILLNRLQEALQLLTSTLQVKDIDTADDGLVLIQTLHYLAMVCMSLGDYDECIWYSQQAIKLNATYREPYFLMARSYIQMGLNTLAEGCVQSALKYCTRKKNWVESESSWYLDEHILFGYIYLNLQQWADAIHHLKQALQFQPNNIDLLKLYIMALENTNKN